MDQAALAAEINKAKAAQYDELAAHADGLEQSLKLLQGQERARHELEQRAAELATMLKVCWSRACWSLAAVIRVPAAGLAARRGRSPPLRPNVTHSELDTVPIPV